MEENGLHEPENPFPLAEWRILLENTFPLDEKKRNYHWQESLKMEEKWFALARKSAVHLQE